MTVPNLGAEAQAWARADSASLWQMLCRHGLRPMMPGLLRNGFGTLLRRGRAKWPNVGESAVPPWLLPEFARRHRLWEKGREAFAQVFRAPYEESSSRFSARCEIGNWSNWHLAGPRGLHTGRPFTDPRLISFSLALPQGLRLPVQRAAEPVNLLL